MITTNSDFTYSQIDSDFLLKGFSLDLEIDFEESFKCNDLRFKKAEISNLSKLKNRMKIHFLKKVAPLLIVVLWGIFLLLFINWVYLYVFSDKNGPLVGLVSFIVTIAFLFIFNYFHIYLNDYEKLKSEEALSKKYNLSSFVLFTGTLFFIITLSFSFLKIHFVNESYFTLGNSKEISSSDFISNSITEIFSYDKIISKYRVLNFSQSNSKTYIYDTNGTDYNIKIRTIEYNIVLSKGDYLLDDKWKKIVNKAEKDFFVFIDNNPIKSIPKGNLEKELLYSNYKNVFLELYLVNDINLTIDSIDTLDIKIKKGEIKK